MKKHTIWMMAAILTLCGSPPLLTSCSVEDNATEEVTTMSYSIDGRGGLLRQPSCLQEDEGYHC